MLRENQQMEYLAIVKILPAPAKTEQRFDLPEIRKMQEDAAGFYSREDKIPLPSWIEKTESPDFSLTLPNGDRIGIEVTMAIEPAIMMANRTEQLPECYPRRPLRDPKPSKKETREDAKAYIRDARNSNVEISIRALKDTRNVLAKKLCEPVKSKLKKVKDYKKHPEQWLVIYDCTEEACDCGFGYADFIPCLIGEMKKQSIKPFDAFKRIIILSEEALVFENSWDNHKIIPVKASRLDPEIGKRQEA